MAVEHALGIAGCARAVAQHRAGVLVETRPLQVAGLARDQRFMTKRADAAALVAIGVAQHHVLANRSEEHTSELQSLMRTSYAVFCLKQQIIAYIHTTNPINNTIYSQKYATDKYRNT